MREDVCLSAGRWCSIGRLEHGLLANGVRPEISYDKPRLRMIARRTPRMIERGVARAPKVCGLGHVPLDLKVRRVSGLMPERSRKVICKHCRHSGVLMMIGAALQCMWSHVLLLPTCGRCSERVDVMPLGTWSHRLGTRAVGWLDNRLGCPRLHSTPRAF